MSCPKEISISPWRLVVLSKVDREPHTADAHTLMAMTQHIPKTHDFRKRLNESLRLESLNFVSVPIPKHQPVYTCGDTAETIYFIESGQVKLLMLSPDGKECLLAIHTDGDTFGELCLAGSGVREETAMAMEDTRVKRIPCSSFFRHLNQNSLIEGFVHYLVARVGEQQRVIANLITVDSEHRLGETLLFLAHKLGQPDPRSMRIEKKITHEELSEMVGTTRPRITSFMLQFRALGLIEITPEHFLVIKEKKLSEYLARIA
jgi:CRP/FNR family cyclic AMP-dependent transcriptional regulator